MRGCYTYTLYIPVGLIFCNMLCVPLLYNNVQINLLAEGGARRAQEWEAGGLLWIYFSCENSVSQKRLNLPELLPNGMNYEGFYRRSIYSRVYSQFMADSSESGEATLKPLKTLCFITPPQHCTVTVAPQTTPPGPPQTSLISEA